MTRRLATIMAAVAGVLGVLLTLGGVIGWRMVIDSRTLPVTSETCDTDMTLSGFQGWCVLIRHRDAGLFTDEVTQLSIVGVWDGGKNPRAMWAPFPFTDPDEPITVTFEETSITVTGENGVGITYPESLYQLT